MSDKLLMLTPKQGTWPLQVWMGQLLFQSEGGGLLTGTLEFETPNLQEAPRLAAEAAVRHGCAWTGFSWCIDCHEYPEPVMLTHEVWGQLEMPLNRGLICWACVEKRLGRPLGRRDLLKVQCNENILRAADLPPDLESYTEEELLDLGIRLRKELERRSLDS